MEKLCKACTLEKLALVHARGAAQYGAMADAVYLFASWGVRKAADDPTTERGVCSQCREEGPLVGGVDGSPIDPEQAN